MKADQLSLRLDTVANFVVKYGNSPIRLADIGTDHAYLPVNLLLNEHVSFAIAGDVAKGPLKSAENEVNQQSLQSKIDVRLGDGLKVIREDDRMNTVTICGMGGKLISTILEEGHHLIQSHHTLILQPNTGGHILRQWLSNHDYHILDETMVAEDGHMYEIIVAQTTQSAPKYSAKQIYLGPCHMIRKSKIWKDKLQAKHQHLSSIVHSMSQAKKVDYQKLKDYQDAMSYIEEEIFHNDEYSKT